MKEKNPVRYQYGTVKFEVIGGRGERFLDACIQKDIVLQEISATPTGFMAQVPLRDYKRLHRLARTERCRLRVRERRGFSFFIAPYTKRIGVFLGIAAAIVLLNICSNLIWNINFYDFTIAEQKQLRKQMYEHGIYEGAFADKETLDKAAQEIFIGSQQYSWVQFNFVHGRLVAEKVDRTKQPDIVEDSITNVIATSDGVIVRQIVADGFALKTAGQFVVKGEVLISGYTMTSTDVPLYAHAMGQVYAKVEKVYVCIQPLTVSAQVPTTEVARYHTLLLPGNVRLPLFAGEIPQQGSAKILREPLSPFGFHLPGTLETAEVRSAQPVTTQYSAQLARDLARIRIFDTVAQEFGSYQLLEQQEDVQETQDGLRVSMRLTFVTDIGEIVPFSGLT